MELLPVKYRLREFLKFALSGKKQKSQARKRISGSAQTCLYQSYETLV